MRRSERDFRKNGKGCRGFLRVRLACAALCLCMATVSLSGCNGTQSPQGTTAAQGGTDGQTTAGAPIRQVAYEYLDTVITITIYDSSDRTLLDHCFEIIAEYEDKLSRTLAGTQIYELNEKGTAEMDDDVLQLLQKGLYYSELSKGVFDITVEPISSLWDFKAAEPSLPDAAVLEEAVRHVDYTKLSIDGNQVTLTDPESGVDLGAIAKGYVADRVKEYLVGEGVKSAIIDLGGNILCIGHKPDGSTFNVGLQYPFAARSDVIAIVQIDDFSVVTSGIDQRNFTIDDVLYHHILDTQTGYPCENNLLSVTIISEHSVDGDGLSTTCFGLGLDKGLELIDSLDGIYAVFVTDDYVVHYSEGFEEHIQAIDVPHNQ